MPGRLVRLNVAGWGAAAVVAVTCRSPGVWFAVAGGAVAIPIAFVFTVVDSGECHARPACRGGKRYAASPPADFRRHPARSPAAALRRPYPRAALCPLPSNTVMLTEAAGAIWNGSLNAKAIPPPLATGTCRWSGSRDR